MAALKEILNNGYKALVQLTAFTDLALLNSGFPLVIGEALTAELRFYATGADCEDYALIGQRAAQWTDQTSACLGQTTNQLGSDRRLLNKLGRREFCASTAGDHDSRSMFQQRVCAKQKVFVIVNAALLREQVDLVRAGLAIYVNQVALLKRTTRDSLTDLLNRDAFESRMHSLYAKNGLYRRRRREPTCSGCFAIADIDNFKHVNDTFGHVYGDKVLVMFAQIMRDSFRADDVLCRFGGEEFIIVLADVDVAVAMKALQRFNHTVAKTEFPQAVEVTVSVGCTQLDLEKPLDTMTARADKALYYAKTHGRNKLCYYEDLPAGDELNHDKELLT